LRLPVEPANLGMDLSVIAEAFVVTVVGGLGSIPGAFVAALVIGLVRALCIALGTIDIGGVAIAFPKLTLVAEFVVMAIVLAVKPYGLLGSVPATPPTTPIAEFRELVVPPGRRALMGAVVAMMIAALLPFAGDAYALVLATDILVFALFAASLQFLMGTGGLASFGHAAYFGIGAYAAALAIKHGWPMEAALAFAPIAALLGAIVFGWFCVRLSGVYLAMLTLAFAQIVWSIAFQWDSVTGGSNGVVGVWPTGWLADRRAYYWFALVCGAALGIIAWLAHAPFGYGLRAGRDLRCAPRRSASTFAVRNGWRSLRLVHSPVSPAESLHSPRAVFAGITGHSASVDALVMVLLGGLNAIAGPLISAAAFTWLSDTLARVTQYWHAMLGVAILVIVIAFPMGIGGVAARARRAVPMMEPVLAVEGVRKAFGGVDAVIDVSLRVKAGERVALIGPNGAGKTTCFNLVNGQLAPDAGSITLMGERIEGLEPREIARRGVGRTFQIAATFASMTVRENVQMALIARDGRQSAITSRASDLMRAEADALLDRVGMAALADQAARRSPTVMPNASSWLWPSRGVRVCC
jgi:branched-chain amino acid transport system permease protein